MITYSLPETLSVDGVDHPIRSGWTAVLDILASYSDPDLTDYDKAAITLKILYKDGIPANADEALRQAAWFIDGGQEQHAQSHARLMDWEQDFPLIISEINHVAGREVRADPDMHWWTFLAYYTAMGDCAFANVVSIRKKLQQGKRLEKYEREFYRHNPELVNLRTKYSEEEQAILREIAGR